MGDRASEWGFTRLIIGLNTAVLGLLVYGHQQVMHVYSSRWLLAIAIVLLVLSLFAALIAAWLLQFIDEALAVYEKHVAEEEKRVAGDAEAVEQHLAGFEVAGFDKQERRYRYSIRTAIVLFGSGVLTAVVYFLWNLLSRTPPLPVSPYSNGWG